MARRFVLASASPARLGVLRAAGLDPEVVVSGIDEDIVDTHLPGAQRVVSLAEAKVASVVAASGDQLADALVLGCDSMLEFDGQFVGKPPTEESARQRIRSMRGKSGVLHTGHAIVDTSTGRCVSGAADTIVHFGNPTDAEIDAYIATGEPMAVAGAFTLDGRSAPFLAGIEGDHGNVIGVSLPLVRELLAELGVSIVELWV